MLVGVTEGRLGQVGTGEEGVFRGHELHDKNGKDIF